MFLKSCQFQDRKACFGVSASTWEWQWVDHYNDNKNNENIQRKVVKVSKRYQFQGRVCNIMG